uniref:Protein-cysteine N-palmitoyltransferase HHAT n=1 Tax=Haemonchus contortus TaxID=6289 RepID=A0A7I4YN31_HAECO
MSSNRFVPVPLNRWETGLCWLVWIFHSLAAFVIAYNVSQGHLKPWIQHWLTKSSYVNDTDMDLSDTEWQHFRNTVGHVVFSHFVHSLLFFLATRIPYPNCVKLGLIVIGTLAHIYLTSLRCILILSAFAAVVTILSAVTRSIAIPWIMCVSFILKGTEMLPFTWENYIFYQEFNVYLYGAVKILNFSLYLCKNKDKEYGQVWVDHLLYMAYLPYSMTIIVLYEDFSSQIQRRLTHGAAVCTDLRFVCFFAVRLCFWYFVFEFILHFIHVHSLYNSPVDVIDRLNNYELAAVSYVTGKLFFMKYVVLFGLPSLFAYLDGMRPPPPPICISRVSRYSRMWRHFDAGLYQFLKNQVYIPLMTTFSPGSTLHIIILNLSALFAVFGVVLAWHGTRTHYICWVSLSAAELIIEKIGKAIWGTKQFQELRRNIGDRNTRRLIALSMLATVIPGIFGVFFFLGSEGTGSVVFHEILTNGIKDVLHGNVVVSRDCDGFVFLHLILLGYFFNNVCLDFEKNYEKEKKKI